MGSEMCIRDSIISIADLSDEELLLLLNTALKLKNEPNPSLLDGKLIASCFFEPSTRTRLSFETAVQRLGGKVIGFADGANTSAKKGETLADTARIISSYADAIIQRHPQDGAARVTAEFSHVPVLNAGDGTHQHPTQALLDAMTLRRWYAPGGSDGPAADGSPAPQGRDLAGAKVVIVGDVLHSRVARSNVDLMTALGALSLIHI